MNKIQEILFAIIAILFSLLFWSAILYSGIMGIASH